MLKYVRFQLYLAFKKVSTYLIPIIFIASIFLSTALLVLISDVKLPLASTITPFTMILPFVISAIFVAMKAINIFKTPEEDGSELLIVSKPIIRFKIVSGKFLSLFTLLIFFSIVVTIGATLITFVDLDMPLIERVKFIFSFGVGSLIIQTLLSTIIVFFASIFTKVWTMVISIFLPIVATIMSLTLVGFTSASTSIKEAPIVSYVNSKGKTQVVYSTDLKKDTGIKNNVDSKYTTAAYFDIWGQLQTFYTMFNDQEPLVHWQSKGKLGNNIQLDKIYNFQEINSTSNKRWYALNNEYSRGLKPEDSEEIIDEYTNKFFDIYSNAFKNYIQDLSNSSSQTNLNILQELRGVISNKFFANTSLKYTNNVARSVFVRYMNQPNNSFAIWLKDVETNWNQTNKNNNYAEFSVGYDKLFQTEKEVKTLLEKNTSLELKPFITRGVIITIWVFITLFIGSLVFFRYLRRDFK